MVRVNNLAETDSSDNTAVKGLENKSQQSEKFGNIAVDSWKDMEKNYKDSTGKFGKNGSSKDGLTKEDLSKDGLSKDGLSKDGLSKDGLSKDGSALTFDDPFKKGKSDSSSTLQEKKMMSDEDAIRNKKEQALDDANMIQKKKELAADDANMIQKKKELADGGPKDLSFDKDFYLQML
ncbi:MAG: hypothetical protein WC028_13750 [Candidatus Obscuribacterales bacterium]